MAWLLCISYKARLSPFFFTINYLTNDLDLYHLYANYLIKIEVERWALSVSLLALLFSFLKLNQFQTVNAQSSLLSCPVPEE